MPDTRIPRTGRIITNTASMASTVGVFQAPPGAHTAVVNVAAVSTFGFGPKIDRAVTLVSTTSTEVKANLIDADSTTTASFNSFAATSKFYIGSRKKFRGMYVDITNANGTANTIAVKYTTAEATFSTVAGLVDNTDTGGSFGQDGLITWTLPTDWLPVKANLSYAELDESLFWVELSWDVAFDSTTSVAAITLLQDVAPTADSIPIDTYVFEIDNGGVGGLEHLDAGTGAIYVLWITS